ncbi:putative 2-hydroxy-3-oxopropionate reductase [Dioscorea sansibarensis]
MTYSSTFSTSSRLSSSLPRSASSSAVAVGACYPTPIRPGKTRVGWIGTGVMGSAMAGRVLAAGYAVAVYARSPAKFDHLRRAGAQFLASPADVARSSDVVFTMVGHPSDVRSVVLDPTAGVVSSLNENGVLVDCTSSHPTLAREIAEAAKAKSCWSIDAPVSGAEEGARNGKLAIFAGGNEDVIEWLRPLFDLMGKAMWMGGAGSGQSSKIANQIVVAANLMGMSEAMVFAEKAGLERRGFFEAVRSGAAGTKVMELFGWKVVERDYEPGALAEYMVKDLGMGLDEEGMVLPGAALNRQMFMGMVSNGDGKLGIHGLVTVIERMNNMRNC